MNAVTVRPCPWPRDDAARDRMLIVRGETLSHASVRDFPDALASGDVVVLNDAGTLPASFAASAEGVALEVRLAQELIPGRFVALLFGEGDYRTRTEDRRLAPPLSVGNIVTMRTGRALRVVDVDSESARLVVLEPADLDRQAFIRDLYATGAPVQYAHVDRPLPLHLVQTPFADRPFAFEVPSASRALGFGIVAALEKRGIEVVSITHAAGLSSSGDPALDRRLPLAERYIVGTAVCEAVARAKALGAKVVAAGTSVVRALESAARRGTSSALLPHEGITELRIDGNHELRVVDALFTGIHVPGESHHDLLEAFASHDVLRRAVAEASARGYLAHEFGDSMLLLRATRDSRS